ncbi:MAG: WbqC family protein [Bacteroidota bacterium]
MKQIVIEPHYFGSLEYYCLLTKVDSLILEINDRFQKQTFRNRCYLNGSNGIITLIVPVSYTHSSLTREVTIDHTQRWKKDHWGAVYSAYGKAPFFEHFADLINEIWNKKHKYLIDLNREFLELTCKLLSVNVNLTYATTFIDNYGSGDLRNVILPKKPYTDRKIYQSYSYSQLFSDTFIPNMSIIDLIMCEGPRALEVLSASFLMNRED